MSKSRYIKTKIFRLDGIVVILNIILSCRSSSFVRSDLVLLAISAWILALLILKGKEIGKNILVPFYVLIIYLFLDIVFFGLPNISAYLRLATKVFLVYSSLKVVKNYWYIFEKISFRLVILSLVLFPIQILFPSFLISILKPFSDILNSSADDISVNILVYTIHHSFISDQLVRNSGYLWEPGAFSAFIILSVIVLFLRENFTKNNYKRYVIYLIAIITTFSTMGYICLLLFAMFVLINKYKKQWFLITFLGLPIFIGVSQKLYQLPFMGEKIRQQIDISKSQISKNSFNNREFASLGRFTSIYAGIESIKKNPITGIGFDDTRRYNFNRSDTSFNWSNGLIEYMLKFGIIGLFFLYYSIYKSIELISNYQINRAGYHFIVILIFITLFSNPIALTPIYISLQLYFLFYIHILNKQ